MDTIQMKEIVTLNVTLSIVCDNSSTARFIKNQPELIVKLGVDPESCHVSQAKVVETEFADMSTEMCIRMLEDRVSNGH